MYRRGGRSPVAVGTVLPSLLAVLLAVTFAVAPRSAAADTEPHLLLDIYDGPPADLGSDPELLESVTGGRVVLVATDPLHGREPCVTDGTAEGTFLLADIAPGAAGSGVERYFSASTANRVFFLARSDERALWVTDGTAAGTRRLLGALRGPTGLDLRADGEGRAFLLAQDLSGRPGLWVSDGSPAGTRRLPHAGLPSRKAGTFVGVLGNRVLFVAGTGIGATQELWASDGSAAGTRRLLPEAVAGPPFDDPPSGTWPLKLHAAALTDGTAVVFQDLGKDFEPDAALALWRTDGTPEGTHRERILDRMNLLSTLEGPRAVFSTWGLSDQAGLWITDGTAAGTLRVFEPSNAPTELQWLGERLVFVVGGPGPIAGAEPRSELWAVDAGDASAHRVAELPGFQVGRLLPFRGGVTLVVQPPDSDLELWWSDGTAAGTGRVASLGISYLYLLTAATVELGGTEELVFGTYREDVWDLFASDGTGAGTRHLARFDLSEGESFSETPEFLPVAGGVLFSASDSDHGREPWITDGTAEGTHLVRNVSAAVGTGDAWPRGLTRYRDTLLFLARDTSGWELWQTDGTGPGSRKIRDLHFQVPPYFQPDFNGPGPLALIGDRLFFIVPTADAQQVDLKVAELPAGLVRHLGRFPRPSGPPGEGAVAVGDRLLWAPTAGQPLVVSDGTLEGTRKLPLRFAGMAGGLAALPGGPALVLAEEVSAEGEALHRGLWRTDGTEAGSRLLLESEGGLFYADLTPVAGGLAYFVYDEQAGGSSGDGDLWRTDGTAEGTVRVESFGGVRPTDLTSSPSGLFFFLFSETTGGEELWLLPSGGGPSRRILDTTSDGLPLRLDHPTPFGSGILFLGSVEFLGGQPWVSDGTPEGTRPLGDPVPGPGSLAWEAVATLGKQAFLYGNGRIWRTDGTSAGTFAVVGDPPAGIPIGELAGVGDRLLYVGTTFETGRELWVLPVEDLQRLPPPPPPSRPAAPIGLTINSGTDDLFLSWTAPAGDPLYFEIEARTPASGSFELLKRSHQSSDFVVGLTPGIPYTFRIRAVNAAGVSPPSNEATASLLEEPVTPCQPSATALCLLDGRFELRVWWRDPRTGGHGEGRAIPFANTDLSGTFWFFDPANVELIVKALDGTAVNRRWWVFTGGLTDVEYWLRVVDVASYSEYTPTNSFVRWYHHPPPSLCGFADTDAFAGEPGTVFPLPAGSLQGEPPATELDLLGGRYRVGVDWRDPRSGDTGVGRAIPGSDNTGYFWFFVDGNVELVVKVLDGTPVNGHRWVFYGGLTDVEYTLHVADRETGTTRDYHHTAGDLCGDSDTRAFEVAAPSP